MARDFLILSHYIKRLLLVNSGKYCIWSGISLSAVICHSHKATGSGEVPPLRNKCILVCSEFLHFMKWTRSNNVQMSAPEQHILWPLSHFQVQSADILAQLGPWSTLAAK